MKVLNYPKFKYEIYEFCQTKDAKQQENLESILKLSFEYMKENQEIDTDKNKSNKKCLIL